MQAPDFSQSFNRYAYVWNNPLKYTDPSGYRTHYSRYHPGDIPDIPRNPMEGFCPSFGGGFSPGMSSGFGSGFGNPFGVDWIRDYGDKTYEDYKKRNEDSWTYLVTPVSVDGKVRYVSHIGPLKFKFTHENGGLLIQGDGVGTNGELVVFGVAENSAGNVVASSGGGGWEPYAGIAGAVTSEMYYSEKYGTWMGKNFKLYKQQWGGNGVTGGKLKFGKKVSSSFKIGGYGLGVWNAYKINSKHSSGQISNGQMYMEQGSNVITTIGGLYGAAWGVGWELGRAITNMGWYQEAKFNFWYNRWESQFGAPSQSNEVLWNYFFQNYKP